MLFLTRREMEALARRELERRQKISEGMRRSWAQRKAVHAPAITGPSTPTVAETTITVGPPTPVEVPA